MTEDPAGVGKIWKKKTILNAFSCWNFETFVSVDSRTTRHVILRDSWSKGASWNRSERCNVAISLDKLSTRPRCDLWLLIFFDDNRKTSWIHMILWILYIQYIYIYMILYDKHKHYDMYSILLHIYMYTYLALYPSQDFCSMQPGSAKGTHWRNHGQPFLNPIGCWWTNPYL